MDYTNWKIVVKNFKDKFNESCPKNLKDLPQNKCNLGESSSHNPLATEPVCPWWINSEKHNFCFWTYVEKTSSVDGVMSEHSIEEIQKLLNIPKELIDKLIAKSLSCIKESDKILSKVDDMNDEDVVEEVPYFNTDRDANIDDFIE